jgi:hypothetical protein
VTNKIIKEDIMNINKLKRWYIFKTKLNNATIKILRFILKPIAILENKYTNYKYAKKQKIIKNITYEQAIKMLGDNIIKHLIKYRDYEEVTVANYISEGYGYNILDTIRNYTKSGDLLREWSYQIYFRSIDEYEKLTDSLKDYLNSIDGVKAEYYIETKSPRWVYTDYRKTLKIELLDK